MVGWCGGKEEEEEKRKTAGININILHAINLHFVAILRSEIAVVSSVQSEVVGAAR